MNDSVITVCDVVMASILLHCTVSYGSINWKISIIVDGRPSTQHECLPSMYNMNADYESSMLSFDDTIKFSISE